MSWSLYQENKCKAQGETQTMLVYVGDFQLDE